MYTIEKTFPEYPAAHRQPFHDGHCALIHGHNWTFKVGLRSETLDGNGFVYDFGHFKWLKEWLNYMFDHTLLLQANDPELTTIETRIGEFSAIRIVNSVSAEGLAELVYNYIRYEKPELAHMLAYVTVEEDSKNSATYTNTNTEV